MSTSFLDLGMALTTREITSFRIPDVSMLRIHNIFFDEKWSLIIIQLIWEFFHNCVSWWVFLWSLSDSKYPQVSRTLLSILADLNNDVVWMVYTRALIFKSYSVCANPLVILSKVLITISTTFIFMFHIFFVFLKDLGTYLSIRFLKPVISRNCKVHYSAGSPFFLFFFFFL